MNMSNNIQKHLQQLQSLSATLATKVQTDMKIVDLSIQSVFDSVPDDQKGMLEKLKVNMNKVVSLAKEGKQDEVNELIKSMENECKNN